MFVVYSCSKLFEKYCKLSIESVLKHNPKAQIIIITKDILDLPYKQIKPNRELKIKGLECDYGYCAYSKLLLPEILDLDKVIYLGADTICQGTLKELWDTECTFINACNSWQYSKIQAQELGIKNYINVDMMVMNLEQIRKINFAELAIKNQSEIENKLTMWCNEESLINYTYSDKISILPQKYNYAYARKYDNPMPYNEATIIHFIGREKDNMFRYLNNKLNNI